MSVASRLTADDVGRRVVVRYRLPRPVDGKTLTDVVGVLTSYDDQAVEVRRIDARTERIRTAAVVAAKPVPPMVFRALDRDELMLATARGRPAVETDRLGDWVLRASDGWTGRANSVLPYGDPGRELDEALRTVVEFYTIRKLPPLALVPLGSEAERLFRSAGWVDARPEQADALVLHTTLDLVNAEPPVEVAIADQPDEDWYAAKFGTEPVPPAARLVLEAATTVAFASVRADGRVVAVGRGAASGQWLGIDSVTVLERYRRRGYGTAVLNALARWAGGHNARRTYLEVLEDNAAAIRLYRSLGYAEAYRYRYLTTPETPGQVS